MKNSNFLKSYVHNMGPFNPLSDDYAIRKRAWFEWYNKYSTERWSGLDVLYIYGPNASGQTDIEYAGEWIYRDSFRSAMYAHSYFRRTCQRFNIELDYTQWMPELSLERAVSDPDSWLYNIRMAMESPQTKESYNFDNDIYFMSWLLAPPVRRHATYAPWSWYEMEDWGDQAYLLRPPFVLSPANAIINTMEDACYTYQDFLP